MTTSRALDGHIALVTGASRGIGAEAARALARAGAHVIVVARTVGGLEELDDSIREAGSAATLVPLDLQDYGGLAGLGAALNERFGRLDVLVGNAALLGPVSPLGHVEPKAWEDVFAVNVTANWHLIRSMDPLLRKADAGRVVFVTSGAAVSARAYLGPYAASKAALNALARVYAAETETTRIRVNLFDPGTVRTRMRAQLMPGEDPLTLKTPDIVAEKLVRLCLPDVSETGKLYSVPQGRFLDFKPPE